MPTSMKKWAVGLTWALAIAGPAQALVDVDELGSDMTILLHNDLWGSMSSKQDGVIVLGAAKTRDDARDACKAVNEDLWKPTNQTDFLRYLDYKGRNLTPGRYWIGGDKCRAITPRGRITNSECETKLPALCTDSAPIVDLGHPPNHEERWQTTVKTGAQTITGFRDKMSFRFQGVRYAQQPKRFTHSEVTKVTEATTAFGYGSGGDLSNDGTFVASRGDVVVVTINYRLGSLGFLALNDGVTKGNYGLADQITALDWVREHIKDFGGDPDNITVFGQSAGGASVHAYLQSPKAIGKFAAGIQQSHLGGLNYATTYSQYLTIPEQVRLITPLLNSTGCLNAESQVECLRKVDAVALSNPMSAARYIVIDNDYILHRELPLNGEGKVAKVPLMTGYTHDDGNAFIGFPRSTDLETELNRAQFNGSLIVNSGLFPLPSGPNGTLNVFNVTSRVSTDGEFRCMMNAASYAAAKNKVLPAVYYYDWVRTYQGMYNPNAPVCEAPKTDKHPAGDPTAPHFKCHCGELFYTWGTIIATGTAIRDEIDIPMSQYAVDIWTSFARDHTPNPDKEYLEIRGYTNTTKIMKASGKWEPFRHDKPEVRFIDWPSKHVPIFERKQCDLLGLHLDHYDKKKAD
ncbi:hypothetical protein FQN57_005295 [Myotisia sp. PD_48]|nr:hypothetical protein FQN57_005295 [Myotisia sp. PD_48]